MRTKIIWLALVPTAIVLVAVSGLTYLTYKRVSQQLIQERYAYLAMEAATRLSENLKVYEGLLAELAQEEDIRSLDTGRQRLVLERWGNRLYPFDGGVVIANARGIIIWSQPLRFDWIGHDLSDTLYFAEIEQGAAVVYSGLMSERALFGQDMTLVGVPFLDSDGQMGGMVAGVFQMNYPQLSPIYAEMLKVGVSQQRYGYLVDANSRVLFHPDASQVGTDLSYLYAVKRALYGREGAAVVERRPGEVLIVGYAPVPGAGWALLVQEDWNQAMSPIRRFTQLLLASLLVSLLIPLMFVYLGIQRMTRPITALAEGAERLANGDFTHIVSVNSGDELQRLAHQFNMMSRRLAASYATLEHKVEERTRELSTLNAIAATVSRSLDLPEVLDNALTQTTEAMGVRVGGMYLLEERTQRLHLAAQTGLDPGLAAEIATCPVDADFPGGVLQSEMPLVLTDASTMPRLQALASGVAPVRSLAAVPLPAKSGVLGVLFVASPSYREFTSHEMGLLVAIGQQIGVAVENARLFTREQTRARQLQIINEINRRITQILSLHELLPYVTQALQEAFDYYCVRILLREEDGQDLMLRAVAGNVAACVPLSSRFPALDGEMGRVIATGELLVSADPLDGATAATATGGILVPIKIAARVIGVLEIRTRDLAACAAVDLNALQTFADQVAVAIENARLYEQSRDLAIVEERNRLARELHDSVTQSLFSIVLNAEAANALLARDVDRARQTIERLQEVAQDALAEMRSLIYELRPPHLGEEDLESALQRYADIVQRRYQIPITMRLTGETPLPRDLEQSLYRIAQEALANVIKHAQAKHVEIALGRDQHEVSLMIRDDGVGFDPTSLAHDSHAFGLISMRDRTELLGGIFEVTARPGEGTCVHVRIPLQGTLP
mgnify:CR=1 FL=1